MIRKDGVYNYSLAAFLKPSDRSVPSKYDVAAQAGASGISSREPVIFCCLHMISLVKQDSLYSSSTVLQSRPAFDEPIISMGSLGGSRGGI